MWLTELLRYRVPAGGRSWRLVDVGLDLTDEERPVVATIALAPGPFRGPVERGWEAVARVDTGRRRLELVPGTTLPRTTALQLGPPSTPRRHARAAGSVLDSLVLDLPGGRATRINDLRLAFDSGDAERSSPPRLVVEAADVGPWGLVRRLSRGLLDRDRAPDDLIPWQSLDHYRGDPELARRAGDHHERLARLPPGEIARLAEGLPHPHVAELLEALPDAVAADVVEAMSPDRGRRAIDALERSRAGSLLGAMAPENVARLLAGHEAPGVVRLLEAMASDRRSIVVELLRYPEGSVGAVMTNELVRIPVDATAEAARDAVAGPLARVDFAYFLYAVDAEGSLEGVVPLRHLVAASGEARVADLMTRHLVTLRPLEPALVGARRVLDAHLAALPVLGADRRLVGALTVDAAVAVASAAGWRADGTRVFS